MAFGAGSASAPPRLSKSSTISSNKPPSADAREQQCRAGLATAAGPTLRCQCNVVGVSLAVRWLVSEVGGTADGGVLERCS